MCLSIIFIGPNVVLLPATRSNEYCPAWDAGGGLSLHGGGAGFIILEFSAVSRYIVLYAYVFQDRPEKF